MQKEHFNLLFQLEHSIPHRMKRVTELMNSFNAHNYFPTIDSNNRLYTLWTQIPEPIRNFVSFNGEKLVSIDIKNSQPFHSCFLFNPRFWGSKGYGISLQSIDPWLFERFNKKGVLSRLRQHVKVTRDRDDVKLFIEKTTNGTYYEYLSGRYGNTHKRLSTRQKAKEEFMMFMNFDINKKFSLRYKAYQTWSGDFPNVAAVFELIKDHNYTHLSRILQKLEAKMLLVRAVAAFTKKYPLDGVIFPVHDSLITLESKVEELVRIIKRVYSRELHLIPNVKVKILNQQNAYEDLLKYVERKMKPKPYY